MDVPPSLYPGHSWSHGASGSSELRYTRRWPARKRDLRDGYLSVAILHDIQASNRLASFRLTEILGISLAAMSASTLALAIFASVVLYKALRTGFRERGLLPGPPTIPVLGNILQVPTKDVFQR